MLAEVAVVTPNTVVINENFVEIGMCSTLCKPWY